MRKVGGRMSKGSRDLRPGGTSCSQGGNSYLKKGPWTDAEDAILTDYVRNHGGGNWDVIRSHTDLARCGKSCRLRWFNHLRPDIKKGAFTQEEEQRIIELQARLGNKWALIAQKIPGRTDNEIKNFWNTRVKRLQRAGKPIYPDPEDLYQQFPNAAQSAQDMVDSSANGDAYSTDPSNSDSIEIPKFDKFDFSRRISFYMPMPFGLSTSSSFSDLSVSDYQGNLDTNGFPCANYGFDNVGDDQFGPISPGYISDLSVSDHQGKYNTLPGYHTGFPGRNVDLPERVFDLVEYDTIVEEICASLVGNVPFCYSPSSSEPVLTGSKLELPSFQNPDSQLDGSVREPTLFDPSSSHKLTCTLIQNPIEDQAQSDCPLPDNSGLLDAMFSKLTTSNGCTNATSSSSALIFESHDSIPPLITPVEGSLSGSAEPTPTAEIEDFDWDSLSPLVDLDEMDINS